MHSLILGVLKSVKKFLTFPPLLKQEPGCPQRPRRHLLSRHRHLFGALRLLPRRTKSRRRIPPRHRRRRFRQNRRALLPPRWILFKKVGGKKGKRQRDKTKDTKRQK